jgi:hypothetical protein
MTGDDKASVTAKDDKTEARGPGRQWNGRGRRYKAAGVLPSLPVPCKLPDLDVVEVGQT